MTPHNSTLFLESWEVREHDRKPCCGANTLGRVCFTIAAHARLFMLNLAIKKHLLIRHLHLRWRHLFAVIDMLKTMQ